MALAEFLADVDAFVADAKQAFDTAEDAAALEAARVEFLGAKSGRLKAVQKGLGAIEPIDKPAAGKRLNSAKAEIQHIYASAQLRVSSQLTASATVSPPFDPTLPGMRLRLGHLHPLTQTIEELKEIMGRLGFSVADGPEIEDEWHNFEALNIPPRTRPATRWRISISPRRRETAGAAAPLLLRSQTSTVQIRVMEKHAAAGADHLLRPRLSARHGRRHALPDVPPDRGPAGRSPRDDGRPEERVAAVRPQLLGRRRAHPLPALVLPVHRAERRGGHELARPARRGHPLDRDGRGRHGRSQRAARPSATTPRKSPASPSAWASSASAPAATASPTSASSTRTTCGS